MNESYPIQPRLAEQAARDFLTIVRAGMLFELEREIQQAVESHSAACWFPNGRINPDAPRLDAWRDGGCWGLNQPRKHASTLAALLDCDAAEIEPHIVPECIDGPTRRTIVLQALREMANYIRRSSRTTAGRPRS